MASLDPYKVGFYDGYDNMRQMKMRDFVGLDNRYAEWSLEDWDSYDVGYRAGLNASPNYRE